MSESKTQIIAKNTGFMFVRMLLVFSVGLYTSRLILEYLGVEDFGIYNVVGSVVVLFNFFKHALNVSASRFLAYEIGKGDAQQISRIFSMSINCHLILGGIIVVLLELIGVWILNTQLNIPESRINAANWTFQITILTTFFSIVFNPYNSCVIAYEKMNFFAIISIVEVIMKLLIVYCLVSSPIDKLITYAALLSVVSLIYGLCNAIYCYRKFPDCRFFRMWDNDMARMLVSYSGWSLLVNVAVVTTNQSINIFFNIFLGVVANASMGIANQVISHLNQFLTNFTQSFNPQIIKSYAAGENTYFMNLLFSASKISFLILFSISAPIILNIDYVLGIWLGEYPHMAPAFVQTIILFYLIDAIQSPLLQAVHATGKIKIHQIMVSSIWLLSIPFIYLLLHLGYPGQYALLCWTSMNLLCAIGRTIYLHYLISLDIQAYCKKVVIKVMIISFTSIIIPLYISTRYVHDTSNFIKTSLIFFIVFIPITIFFGLEKRERDLIMTLPLLRKINKTHHT